MDDTPVIIELHDRKLGGRRGVLERIDGSFFHIGGRIGHAAAGIEQQADEQGILRLIDIGCHAVIRIDVGDFGGLGRAFRNRLARGVIDQREVHAQGHVISLFFGVYRDDMQAD